MSPSFAPAEERVLGAGEYLLGALELGVVVAALAYAAVRLRRVCLPAWSGAPAHVGDITLGLVLAIGGGVLLGTFGLFTPLGYLLAALGIALVSAWGAGRIEARQPAGPAVVPPAPPLPGYALPAIAIACAVVFAGWAIPTLTGMAGGMGRADSLWYHMPLSARFVQTGSTGGYEFFDPIFFAHFYPANSELLHAIPILAFGRDFLSPFLNLGFLAIGLLAGYAIGRPYGVAAQSLLGAAVLLGAETMINFQGGEALNDIVGVSLLLCSVALLTNGAASVRDGRNLHHGALALAGLAAGLAAGTKLSFLAPVAFIATAVVVVAPKGVRVLLGSWFVLPAVAAGGYWYLRNLVHTGNPIPFTQFGPLSLPAPERAFELRPGFSVAHYWNDAEVWREWFIPKLGEELGPLWFVVLLAVLAGGIYAIWRGREPMLRALAAVAVLTAIAYVFTPLTAGGEEGEPIAFEWNVRYLAPAVAIGLALLPCLPALRASARARAVTLGALLVLVLVTTLSVEQWSAGGHTKGAIATGIAVLALFALAWVAFSRGWAGPGAERSKALALAGVALAGALAAGFAVERHYLERRYNNLSPQLHIAESVRWARDLRDARIAVSGVRGVFNQFAYYGTDLSNHVQWLGMKGPDDAFLRIPDCATWRAALNDGDFDYVVTLYDPYDPARGDLTDTKEALWTREDEATTEVLRDGPVSVFSIDGELTPEACGSLPPLSEAELNGDSVNLFPDANQPPSGAGLESSG